MGVVGGQYRESFRMTKEEIGLLIEKTENRIREQSTQIRELISLIRAEKIEIRRLKVRKDQAFS